MAGIRYKGQIYSGAASVGNADDININDGSGQVTDTQTIISRILGDFAEIESSATASKAYAVGDYLVLNGYFYKATAAITMGDELVEGTNIEKTSVKGELNICKASSFKVGTVTGTTNSNGVFTTTLDSSNIAIVSAWDDGSNSSLIIEPFVANKRYWYMNVRANGPTFTVVKNTSVTAKYVYFDLS